jgi:signal transduction histidine kinase
MPLVTSVRVISCFRLPAICLVALLNILPQSASAQRPHDSERGAYVTDVFLPRDYRGHAQNWVVTQADNDLIYVGNGTSLLEYDGVEWRIIKVRGNAPVRTLRPAPDGRLYIGTAGDFGYLDSDSLGRPAYRSLLDSHPELRDNISDVWAIVPADDGIYFSSREGLFRLQGDSLRSWTPESYFALGFEFGGSFHTVVARDGLVRMEGDSLVTTPIASEFASDIIFYNVPQTDGTILLGSRDRGILRYDGHRTIPFAPDLNERLVRDGHYNATLLRDGRVAVATRNGGLYLIGPDGGLDRHFTEGDGLPDVHVWNVYQDRQDGLWLALNSGIARIDLANPVTRFNEANGLPGIVIDFVRHEGTVYAATSKGLFRMNPATDRVASFSMVIDESAGQCLGLLSTEAGLLVGCELGLYIVDSRGPRRITDMATRLLYRLPSQPDVVLASSRNFIQAMRLTSRGWEIEKRIEVLTPWAISFLEHGEDLWLTTVADGIVRARLNSDLNVVDREFFRAEAGVPDGWTYVTPIDDGFRFHSMQGILEFDPSTRTFVPDRLLTPHLPKESADVFLLRQAYDRSVWFLNGDRLGYISGLPNAPARHDIYQFLQAGPLSLHPEEHSGVTWVPSVDGLFRIERQDAKRSGFAPRVAIRTVHSAHGDSLLAAAGTSDLTSLRLSPGTTGLRFSYALLSFGDSGQNQYRVKLAGVDREWSSWSNETTKDYTNLRAGTYTLQVRARNGAGTESEVASLEIRILPLWYETFLAKLLALILAIAVVGAGVSVLLRFRMARLEAQKLALERQVAERTVTLSRANKRLEAVLEQNADFLSTAAHDLKNPLVSIIGFSELLISGEALETERSEFLALIHESALRMNEAIEQLQTADIVENSGLELHLSDIDLRPVVESVVRRNAYQAERKQIIVRVEADGPVVARVDSQFLPRIIDNLVSNAIKYSTPESSVDIHLRSDDGSAVIDVTDEGPGLTTEDLSRVFGKRERLSARPTNGEGSTGLGLYIVRTLVESHGGSVEVESVPGNGATFRVRLPLAPWDTQIASDQPIALADA